MAKGSALGMAQGSTWGFAKWLAQGLVPGISLGVYLKSWLGVQPWGRPRICSECQP